MDLHMAALVSGVGLLVSLVGLAAVVQWRQPPEDGTSGFVIGVGFVVFLTILMLLQYAGTP